MSVMIKPALHGQPHGLRMGCGEQLSLSSALQLRGQNDVRSGLADKPASATTPVQRRRGE